MDKGTRVRITSGKGRGVSGNIFWKGANKWGPGDRYGVRGDDGETYWVAESDVEPDGSKAPPPPTGPTFDKGDRVRFKNRGEEGTGTVFWVGKSRNGPGQRLGINDDHGEDAVWLDAHRCEPLADEPNQAPQGDAPARTAPPRGDWSGGGAPADEAPYAPNLDMNEMPEAPPIDDAQFDQWASYEEADDEPPPGDW